MDFFGVFKCPPQFGSQPNREMESEPGRLGASPSANWEKGNVMQWSGYSLQDLTRLRRSLLSIISWEGKTKIEAFARKSSSDSCYMKVYRSGDCGCSLPLFRPYVARVPWHKGFRALLSQIFPRYGHYCGPNWSSGKDSGTLLWDKRPVDWLDLCCYCHDIGYDTHDQAKLLKADLAFLECLEKPRSNPKGDHLWAQFYRSVYIAGLKTILIPYRTQLVKLQARQSVVEKKLSEMNRGGTNVQHASQCYWFCEFVRSLPVRYPLRPCRKHEPSVVASENSSV